MYNMCMVYIYSKHFLSRMKERGVHLKEIEEMLCNNVDTILIPSKKDSGIFLLLGFVNAKGIAIIFNQNTGVLITVRRMRKNEKKLFG